VFFFFFFGKELLSIHNKNRQLVVRAK